MLAQTSIYICLLKRVRLWGYKEEEEVAGKQLQEHNSYLKVQRALCVVRHYTATQSQSSPGFYRRRRSFPSAVSSLSSPSSQFLSLSARNVCLKNGTACPSIRLFPSTSRACPC
uniref:Uncharacterized protein n=1 Tax=Caenorhabditis japonica TaxID=281687 RepID=A0A8R1J2F2_CAEJA